MGGGDALLQGAAILTPRPRLVQVGAAVAEGVVVVRARNPVGAAAAAAAITGSSSSSGSKCRRALVAMPTVGNEVALIFRSG